MTEHSLENSVAHWFAIAMDPDRDKVTVPDIEWPVPTCPTCGRELSERSDAAGWRCWSCRQVWDPRGEDGTHDLRGPKDRLREALVAHRHCRISAVEFSDRVEAISEELG